MSLLEEGCWIFSKTFPCSWAGSVIQWNVFVKKPLWKKKTRPHSSDRGIFGREAGSAASLWLCIANCTPRFNLISRDGSISSHVSISRGYHQTSQLIYHKYQLCKRRKRNFRENSAHNFHRAWHTWSVPRHRKIWDFHLWGYFKLKQLLKISW